jgi:hypothetical protein
MHASATTLPSACQSRDEVRAPFADLRRRCADPFDVRGSKVSKKDHDMTRTELTTRLNALLRIGSPASGNVREIRDAVRLLIEDINADGVLDVQAPRDIAEGMNLPSASCLVRMRMALIAAGLTRDDVRACSVADLIALHEAMPS